MRPGVVLTSLGLLLLPASVVAQRPVGEYEVAERYSTTGVLFQLTGSVEEGRDLLLGWGRMYPLGRGRWMPGFELTGGVTSGRGLVDRVLVGPRVSLGAAFPSQYLEFGKRTRAEPYLIASGGIYGLADFFQEDAYGGAPFVAAGVGVRMLNDPWDVDMSLLEVVVERRFGMEDQPAELYVRFTTALTRRPSSDTARARTRRPRGTR
jgi:hypothetical protein